MLPSILIVDDEQEVLSALERILNKSFRVYTFTCPQEALRFYRDQPTHIVISDLRMPVIDGGDFLKGIVAINPKSKRIALTGYADIDLAQKAFNEGKISYYINKPWNNLELKEKLTILVDELKQENKTYNLINKLRVSNKALLVEHRSDELTHEFLKTQQNDMQSVLTQLRAANNELMLMSVNMIALITHEPQGHSVRIAYQAKVIGQRLGWSEIDCLYLYMAGLFHRVGLSTLPHELTSKHWYQLKAHEQQHYEQYIKHSVGIMSSSQFLARSAHILEQMIPLKRQGISNEEETKETLGAKILHTLVSFDLLVSGQLTGHSISPSQAFLQLKNKVKGTNIKVQRILESMLTSPSMEEEYEYPVVVGALKNGMVIAQSIMDKHEHKLLAEGTILTHSYIAHLARVQENNSDPIIVYVKANLNGSE